MVPATHKQGSVHGFVVVKDETGKVIAVGDQVSVAQGNQVRSRLVFHFSDGSIDEERTVFQQGKVLQLVSDHHIQNGPSFKEALDVDINIPSGMVTYHEMKDGKDQVKSDHMELPPDLANGMVALVLQNHPRNAAELKVSYVAGSSKPRIVKLVIKPEVEDTFRVGGSRRHAKRFNIHIELGGVAGVVAPVIGKQPSDIKMWIMDGEVPTFLKMEGAFYQQGPTWTTELVSPMWPNGNR